MPWGTRRYNPGSDKDKIPNSKKRSKTLDYQNPAASAAAFNILMQRTEWSFTVYAKNRINCARPLSLAKKRSAAPDQGVMPV